MPKHVEQRIVPYSTSQLYALVADVGAYPRFLPWCVGARVRKNDGVWPAFTVPTVGKLSTIFHPFVGKVAGGTNGGTWPLRRAWRMARNSSAV